MQETKVRSNLLLGSLDQDTRKSLESKLRLVDLRRGEVLVQAGETTAQLYFPLNGAVVSLLVVTDTGVAIESALTGSEGFVGISGVLGGMISPHQAIVQADGTAYRVRTEVILRELENHSRLRRRLLAYSNFVLAQTSQVALCNRLHQIEERMARWLLLFQDRTESGSLALTHELMSQMLGARRATLSLTASTLQNAGLISYIHGKIQIKDRRGLEAAACECYSATKRHFEEYTSVLNAK